MSVCGGLSKAQASTRGGRFAWAAGVLRAIAAHPTGALGVALFALLAVQFVLIVGQLPTKGETYDEPAHVANGVHPWIDGKYRVTSEQPVLPDLIAGFLPAHFDRIHFNDWATVPGNINWARWGLIPLSLLLAVLVFHWATRVYGRLSGIVALVFCVFSPTILAHSGLATSDIAAGLAYAAFVYGMARFVHGPSWPGFALVTVLVACALLTKFSLVVAFALYPAFGLLAVLRYVAGRAPTGDARWPFPGRIWRTPAPSSNAPRPALRQRMLRPVWLVLAPVAMMPPVFLLIWACYGFTTGVIVTQPPTDLLTGVARALPDTLPNAALAHGMPAKYVPAARAFATRMEDVALHQTVPAPAWFAQLLYAYWHLNEGHQSYLLGRYATSGQPDYFPVIFVTKSTLPELIGIMLALLSLMIPSTRISWADMFIILAFLVYAGAVVRQPIDLGVRYLMPLYPLAFVFISRLARVRTGKRFAAGLSLVAMLCLWQAFEGLRYWPQEIPYFNDAAGGPANGYKIALDSNLDWGQDVALLPGYLRSHPEIKEWAGSFFGNDPYFYNINYLRADPGDYAAAVAAGQNPYSGIFIISLTNRFAEFRHYKPFQDWLSRYDPIDKIGYSIWVYDTSKPPTR